MTAPALIAERKPRPTIHVCPKCHRSVAVSVDATAWCLPCGARMKPVRRPKAKP